MDKKSKEIIKEVIENILYLREHHLNKIKTIQNLKNNGKGFTLNEIKKEVKKMAEDFRKPLIKLNHLLEKKEQYQEVIDLEQQMKKIQSKKNITVKEFSEIYNISKTSQQNYRGRLNDPLPYHQKVEGGKIVYVVEEVEKWFDNQHK